MSSSPHETTTSPPSSISFPHMASSMPSTNKQVKLEIPDTKQPEAQGFPPVGLGQSTKELGNYLWPPLVQPPHYHLLWPGRPLPFLPDHKEGDPSPPKLPSHVHEPFFGLFFANNNFTKALEAEKAEKKGEQISQFMDGPFFR